MRRTHPSPHDSKEVFAQMRQAEPSRAAQQRIVQGALSRLARQRQRWVFPMALAGAAAAVLVLALQVLISSRSGLGGPAGVTQTLQPRQEPLAGTVWRTKATTRRILLGRHRLELAIDTQARLAPANDNITVTRIVVDRGSATFIVAPLDQGRTFRVDTPHARVVVKGTRFSVKVQQRCTRVAVSTGAVLVAVRGNQRPLGRLVSGQSRVICTNHESQEVQPPGEPAPSSGTDREQELQQALRLLLAGRDLRRVERILSNYLQEQPDGVFAEDALFHLIFVKNRLGETNHARSLAKRFLAHFPHRERARRVGGWLKKHFP